ncbi:type II pantothenate kinase [Staphylococcus shinii]|uniref:type II pantothenate kinase n=1 Tax=Staphylococcus shinii TaxID=2912228 RepID=UPI000C31ED09|nr:type II pantothenate kinase [Staphylococcus shinii]MBO3066285.1 type II pantothenate kinase [Staphylococcus shinii]PKI08643.1 type II pantothenate kinase [Staphylococcus shinii]PKI11745.1 type II pantothenate kinase [Staphylococcus shinii]
MKIGIDAGGTLIKIVQDYAGKREYNTRLTTEIDDVIKWLSQQDCESISLTGGQAALINEKLNFDARVFVEFDAAAKGLEILLEEQGHFLDDYIFTNVGTGTSIHFSNGDSQQRVGGVGTGGGMIQGLGYLLTGIKDYKKLTDTAQNGNRDIIDLKVKHIYKDSEPPISGDLTAANFGNVLHNLDTNFTDSDKLASVIGVVGEVITTMSITVAREHSTENVAYIGSSFHNNELLKEVVKDYTVLRGFKPYYIEHGAFSGALGAIHL